MMIKSSYLINEQTAALLPVNHSDYQTLIIERNRQIYIKQTPMEIIQHSCLSRFTLYDGIRKAVMKETGFKRKIPIPINPQHNIYLFPTHSTNDYECCWFSYYHVHRIVKNCNQPSQPSSFIHLKNGQTIPIDVSYYVLKKQMKRTLECVNKYFQWHENGVVLDEPIEKSLVR